MRRRNQGDADDDQVEHVPARPEEPQAMRVKLGHQFHHEDGRGLHPHEGGVEQDDGEDEGAEGLAFQQIGELFTGQHGTSKDWDLLTLFYAEGVRKQRRAASIPAKGCIFNS